MRIVVAMSGGVDSSVAAALLAREGHDVVGLSMQLYDHSEPRRRRPVRHLLHDRRPPRRTARRRTHRHPALHRQFRARVRRHRHRQFRQRVLGRPHADPVRALQRRSEVRHAGRRGPRALGADFVATGHYARVDLDPATGRYRLKRGADPGEGSVVLPVHARPGRSSSHAMFPVGALDKTAVREQARELGLPVADKPDSHEICFVADGDHAAFLERAGADGRRGRDSRRRRARSSAGTRACIASPSASARASGSPPRFLSTSSASTPSRTP